MNIMKGYKVEDRLYIFPQTVDVIPEVEDVDVIYVQHETVKAWKEANEELADKIKGYNYLTITALAKEWAGHSNDDLEITYDITLSGAQDLIQNLSLNKSKAAEDESITITPGGSSYTAQWVDVTSTDAQIAWDNSNTLWSFTMPATDVTATATARTLYHVSKAGDYQSDFSIQPSSYMPQNQYQYDSYVNLVPSDATSVSPTNGYIMTVLTYGADPQTVTNAWSSENSYWYFAMPASDVVATLTHEASQPTTYTITIDSSISGLYDGLYPFGGGQLVDPSSVEAGMNLSIDAPEGYTFNESDRPGTLLSISSNDSTQFDTSTSGAWAQFYMPSNDITIYVEPVAETSYTFEIDEEGNLFTAGSYEEGDSVQYTFDHALQQEEPGMWHYEYTMSPASLDNYNFSTGTPAYLDETDPENPVQVPEVPAEISFTMPASDVLFTITRVEDVQP